MKAILEFNLNEFEDEQAHYRCIKALDMALVIFKFDEYLRKHIKYNENNLSADALIAIEETRDALMDILHDNNISINKLIS
jgi:hypothetical protein